MDKKMLDALKKLYHHTNSEYDVERGVSLYRTDTLEPAARKQLERCGWKANDTHEITHHDINRMLIALQSDGRASWSRIAGAFIAGVGGSFPRGVSSLMSYQRMIHIQEHDYEQAERFVCCKYCGFHRDQWENLSRIRYAIHLGSTYGSTTGAYTDLTELYELLERGYGVPKSEDIQLFTQLLNMLEAAADEETPGQFEKRLTSSKLLKGTAGTRRGILQSLAMLGVLPNAILPLSPGFWTNIEEILNGEYELNNTKHRSDMEMPWAGWQGKLGVNRDILVQLFGEYI
ncbi:hypothetical protein [Paenibacillus sp. P32E]|uniref:hypothetical protein n=1 Tax=Paenibacillus sp. P32E TaxID=1349434 RepID=UPI000938DEF2|nr:hypothetical protein [Paenibacillus sp. P32E]OKP83678.1 hypothetical protein A3848_25680 [Paenibacillus sp. P32E]